MSTECARAAYSAIAWVKSRTLSQNDPQEKFHDSTAHAFTETTRCSYHSMVR